MGFDTQALQFLFHARPPLKRTLTIGRQRVSAPRRAVEALFRSRGLEAPPTPDGFAEPLLKAMSAESVDSLDASPFEGATVIHDLNRPLAEPPCRFTTVIDGGTLEHVFNFPVAVRTCMELVEPGGSLVVMVPSNNEIGHGLYQFNPELFYRVMEHGFGIEQMLVFERGRTPIWYRVADAKTIGHRVHLRTRRSTYLMVHARRTTADAVPELTLQESDYEAAWDGAAPPKRSLAVKVGDRIAPRFGTVLQGRIGSPAVRRVKL